MGAFRVFYRAGRDLFDELFGLMFVNLLWIAMSLPLLAIAFALFSGGGAILAGVMAMLAVLPLGPASAGLSLIAQRVSEGRTFSWRMIFDGFREMRVLSWQVYGIWMLGLILILVNLGFYGQLEAGLGAVLTILFLYILVIWFSLLAYLGPLTVLQTDKSLRRVWRNAAVLALGRPIYTLVTTLMMIVIGALSLAIPLLLLLLTASFFAVWGFRATTTAIEAAEERRREMEEKAAEQESSGPPRNTDKGRGGQIRPRD